MALTQQQLSRLQSIARSIGEADRLAGRSLRECDPLQIAAEVVLRGALSGMVTEDSFASPLCLDNLEDPADIADIFASWQSTYLALADRLVAR